LKHYSIIKENKFDFVRRMMSVLASSRRGSMVIVKGAPESVLKASRSVVLNGKECNLSKHLAEKVMERASFYEEKGYRVIAVAEKQLGKKKVKNYTEKALTAVGFLIFLDPPKKTVKSSLEKFHNLGVAVKIITGDSPVVTKKVCEEVALTVSDGRIITGEELEKLDQNNFEKYCKKYNISDTIPL
jgi:Mg2+-importing ATPase